MVTGTKGQLMARIHHDVPCNTCTSPKSRPLGGLARPNTLQLKEKDFSFCVELPIQAKKYNYKLISVPSHERSRIAGKKKVNDFNTYKYD